MTRNNRDLAAIRQIVREEMNRRTERLVFVFVLVGGVIMLIIAFFVVNNYAQSLLLNLGSNLVVFVSLFGIFQYFAERQPGSREHYPPELKDVFIEAETANSSDRAISPINSDEPPTVTRRRGHRAPTLSDEDQAQVSPR